MDFTYKFNWIDVLAFIILVRIIYIAVSRGFVVEFFKFIATVLGLSVSFHFFNELGDFLLGHLGFLNESLAYPLTFILLYLLVWVLVKYIRTAIILLFRIEPHAVIERWVGLFIGIFRGILFLSIFFFTLYLFQVSYLNKSLNNSFSFELAKHSGPQSYRVMCQVYKKLWPDLEPNQKVDKIY